LKSYKGELENSKFLLIGGEGKQVLRHNGIFVKAEKGPEKLRSLNEFLLGTTSMGGWLKNRKGEEGAEKRIDGR